MKYKTLTTQVSIFREPSNIETPNGGYRDHGGNPVFDCIKVALDDEAGGGYLKITDETEGGEGASVSFDWDEWDKVVEVVAEMRKDWDYK